MEVVRELAGCCDTIRRFTSETIGAKDFTIQETWELYNLTKSEQDLNLLLTNCLGLITGLINKYPKTETEELFSQAQEGFMRAVNTYNSNNKTKFHTYLMTIIRNMFFTYFNRKDNRERFTYETSIDAIMEENPNQEFIGSESEIPSEIYFKIPTYLSEKHKEFIKIVTSGYAEKLPDIAERMNLTIKETKAIKDELRKILKREVYR